MVKINIIPLEFIPTLCYSQRHIKCKEYNMKAKKILRPDSKGRICLGSLAKGVSGYKAIVNNATKEIVLKPYSEFPYSEKWLFENQQALDAVKRGLKQSSDKKTVYKGSFAKFIDEDE